MTSSIKSQTVYGIFTRLAVERNPGISFFNSEKGNIWFQDALNTAKRTSILSVKNLIVKPQYWFVLVDDTLKPELKEQALASFTTATTIQTKLIEVNGWSNTSFVLQKNPDALSCTVQVRLDYDDLLHRDYFNTIMSVTKNRPCLISPVIGISHNVNPARFAVIRKKLPPFLCLLRSSSSDPLTIFSYDHDKWPVRMVMEFAGKPMWMQTITGGNIANSYGRGWMVIKVRHIKELNFNEWTGEARILRSNDSRIMTKNLMEALRELKASITRDV